MTVSNDAKNRYAFFFSVSFIMHGYTSYIPGISLGTLIHIVYSLVSIFLLFKCRKFKIGKKGVFLSPITMVSSLIFLSIISLLFSDIAHISLLGMTTTSFKLIVMAISVSVATYIFFDQSLIFTWLKKVALISTVYLFIQYLAYIAMSIRLPNVFNLFLLRPNGSGEFDMFATVNFFRPSSFFLEPSYYATFVICVVLIYLLGSPRELSNKEIAAVIFLSLGIIASTSTGGLVILPLLLLFGIKNQSIRSKFKFILITVLITTILMLGITYTNKNIYDLLGPVGQTLKISFGKLERVDQSARVGRSYDSLSYLEGIQRFIGIGIGNELRFFDNIFYTNEKAKAFFNSYSYLFVWNGYVGLFVYAIFLFSLIKRNKDKLSLLLILIFIIKGSSSGMFFNLFSILYLSIIIYRSRYLKYESTDYEYCLY